VSNRAAHALILGYVPWCHVVDMKHVYSAPFTAEAVVSRFFDTGNVSVHAWQPTSRPHYYALLQQVPLETQHATGSLEVVLTSSRVHEIQWRSYNFWAPPQTFTTQSNNSLDTYFGSLWTPFTVLGPWPGLPMVSYATDEIIYPPRDLLILAVSGVTSHRQPRHCRGTEGPKTVNARIMYQDCCSECLPGPKNHSYATAC